MLQEHFEKKGIRLSAKGIRWCENLEVYFIYSVILLAFGVVGSIESGRWF
jgi:hypothetical protein